MTTNYLKTTIASAFLFAFGLAPASHAGTIVPFNFNGMGFSGGGTFTVVPNVSPPDPNPLCGTPGQNPCRADPPGAFRITHVTGTFTDARIGIFNAPITGLIPTSPTNERDPVFDPLVPSSLSYLDANLSYNNLFFPDGNPIDCNYPFFGTFLDVFGTAFTIGGGYIVDFWGDGNELPNGGLTFGLAVAQGSTVLDYQFDGVSAGIPEPLSLSLFGAGLLGAAALRRRRKNRS
jgi:hypothetical protein